MFELTVTDHIMIAHSLRDPFFGPAQNLHGATFVVHATFSSETLNPQQVVLDIGAGIDMLKEVLSPLNYQNLDELSPFKGKLTTTEFLAAYIHQELAQRIRPVFLGNLKITLEESPVARASYTAPVSAIR